MPGVVDRLASNSEAGQSPCETGHESPVHAMHRGEPYGCGCDPVHGDCQPATGAAILITESFFLSTESADLSTESSFLSTESNNLSTEKSFLFTENPNLPT